jgi:uncharacterized protein
VAAIEEPGDEDAEARAGERAARTEPVTAVFSRRVRPGREAAFEDWAHGVIAAATRWPGHLGASVLRLETWFDLPGPDAAPRPPPPRWKMWLVSLVALYPLVVLFQWALAPRVEGWPLAAKAAVFPLVLLTTMTYVVMPLVSRVLRRWLQRGRAP